MKPTVAVFGIGIVILAVVLAVQQRSQSGIETNAIAVAEGKPVASANASALAGEQATAKADGSTSRADLDKGRVGRIEDGASVARHDVTRRADATPIVASRRLPLRVPESAVAGLFAQSEDPDVVDRYNYSLGLYGFLDACAGSTVKTHDWFYLYLNWSIDKDGTAHDPAIELNDNLRSGWTEQEKNVFLTCFNEYLARNPTMTLMGRARSGLDHINGTMQIRFPIETMPIYELLRQAEVQANP